MSDDQARLAVQPDAGSATGADRGRLRCARWARDVALDPAGTAPRCDVFILVDHPLPWPSDVGDDPLLAEVLQAARERAGAGRSVRLQALAADGGEGTRRVVVFARGDTPFSGYGRLEGVGTTDQLADIAAKLVATQPPEPVRGRVTDVLVCTHGSRDTCCGSSGTRLWRDGELDGVEFHRTSHTGGHRFAPTALTFPDGNYWAFLDPPLLQGIVHHRLPAAVAATHLRGCAAFPPAAQVADGALLAARGWDWLSCARVAEELSESRIAMQFETPDGERGHCDVDLCRGRRMPIPDCGSDPATAAKSQDEWHVTGLQIVPR
jgi:hypothetical protein